MTLVESALLLNHTTTTQPHENLRTIEKRALHQLLIFNRGGTCLRLCFFLHCLIHLHSSYSLAFVFFSFVFCLFVFSSVTIQSWLVPAGECNPNIPCMLHVSYFVSFVFLFFFFGGCSIFIFLDHGVKRAISTYLHPTHRVCLFIYFRLGLLREA